MRIDIASGDAALEAVGVLIDDGPASNGFTLTSDDGRLNIPFDQ